MVPLPLTEWEPAELALQGGDTARFKLALALSPARSPVLDLVQETDISFIGGVPDTVRVLKACAYQRRVGNLS